MVSLKGVTIGNRLLPTCNSQQTFSAHTHTHTSNATDAVQTKANATDERKIKKKKAPNNFTIVQFVLTYQNPKVAGNEWTKAQSLIAC